MNINDKKLLQWHPAFYAGLQIEFGEESAKLIFEREHNLSTKPMQIDVLVIKKCTNDVINKNIGRIFRKHNIVEYKSPDDYLSINDFYKVYGYTCFYKSETEVIESIKITDVTITFVSRGYPRELSKHLTKTRGFSLEKRGEGIYYITNDIIPMQLLVTSELSEEENLWLRCLTNNLQDIKTIDKLSVRYSENEHNELYKSVMNVIVRANRDKFKEVTSMCEALKELWAEDIEKSHNEGMEKGYEMGHQDGIRRMIISGKELGASKKQIEELLVRNYDITIEQARMYIEQNW